MRYERKEKFTKPYSPADVLKLALEKEKFAYGFYQQLLKSAQGPAMVQLLTQLRDAEEGHIKLIEGMLK